MNEKNSNHNNRMIDIAIMSGCKTIKDFALFLKEHTPRIETMEILSTPQEMGQLSLLR